MKTTSLDYVASEGSAQVCCFVLLPGRGVLSSPKVSSISSYLIGTPVIWAEVMLRNLKPARPSLSAVLSCVLAKEHI